MGPSFSIFFFFFFYFDYSINTCLNCDGIPTRAQFEGLYYCHPQDRFQQWKEIRVGFVFVFFSYRITYTNQTLQMCVAFVSSKCLHLCTVYIMRTYIKPWASFYKHAVYNNEYAYFYLLGSILDLYLYIIGIFAFLI